MDNFALFQWYKEMPKVTRLYFTSAVVCAVLCAVDVLSPYHLYYNYRQIARGEYWRLVSNFLFFGNLGIDFLFHMYFLVRYCSLLEGGSFNRRSADFLWFILFGMISLMAMAPWMNIMFFGSSLTFMLVYLYSKRNPGMQFGLFGLLGFSAPYLPWVLMGFSLMLGHDVTNDMLGIAIGHCYYFMADVYPKIAELRGWRIRKIMYTPFFLHWLFGCNCRRTEENRINGPVIINAQPFQGLGGAALHGGGGHAVAAGGGPVANADPANGGIAG